MKKNSNLRGELFELLGSFSKSELKKFGEYLSSPYHNKSTKLIKAYSFIRKFHPQFKNKRLTLKNIHSFSNADIMYNELTVRNILSDLYKLALTFLAVQGYLSSSQNTFDNILSELNQRRLFNLFDRFVNHIQPALEGAKGWNTDLLFARCKTKVHLVNKELQIMEDEGDSIKQSEQVLSIYDKLFDDFNAFYISILIESYFNQKILSMDADIDISDRNLVKFIEANNFKYLRNQLKSYENSNPLLFLTLRAFDSFYYFEDPLYYIKYKKAFVKYTNLLDIGYQSLHLTLLITYCAKKRNGIKYKKKFTNELLSLFDIMIERKLYKYSDVKYLDLIMFRNMIGISLDIGDYSWAAKLIDSHINVLDKRDQEAGRCLGLMLLNFHARRFDEALEYANKFPTRYHHLKFDIINTKLKIFYEKQHYYPALDLIRSYQSTLTKTELVPLPSRNSHKNLLSVLKTLIKIQLGKKNPDKRLINELRKKAKYVYSNWLTQKLDEVTGAMSKTGT